MMEQYFFQKNKNNIKNWIAATVNTGRVIIDEGATIALNKGASLLPSGITGVYGNFKR